MRFGGNLDGDLEHFSVIGHQAVDLGLDIGCLGINRCGQAGRGDHRMKLVPQVQIGRSQSGLIAEADVAPVFFPLPGMSFDR